MYVSIYVYSRQTSISTHALQGSTNGFCGSEPNTEAQYMDGSVAYRARALFRAIETPPDTRPDAQRMRAVTMDGFERGGGEGKVEARGEPVCGRACRGMCLAAGDPQLR